MTNALYLRLSIADGDLGKDNKDESNSIENQRKLLEDHVQAHQDLEGECVEYIDDGYSGTNFDRPAFRRMIEDAKRGRFQTILVKDLSRLGRDYIGVGDYLDQIFPVLGIRFIAVNSNYDSKAYAGRTLGLDMTVTNLVNTLYSRDLSKKIKSSIRSKWQQGKTTCRSTPYGYVYDEKAKGGWAIDPDAAAVVREIFDRALDGWNTKAIANLLNEKRIPTPGKYRKERGQNSGTIRTVEKEVLWTTTMVLSILKRYEYTGAFVHNKRVNLRVGSKETRTVPEQERIIIEDAHDAIVTKEEFYQARNVLQHQRKHAAKIPMNYALKGKVRCGNCRLALAYQVNLYEPAFYCAHSMMTGDASKCCKDYYSERVLEEAVFETLCSQLKLALRLRTELSENAGVKKPDIQKQLRRLKKQVEIKRAERIRTYEVFAEGHLSREEYLEKKEAAGREIEVLEQEIEKLSAAAVEEEEFAGQMDELSVLAEKIICQKQLTEEIVKEFIDMVYVYDKDHIEVVFAFEDLLKTAIKKVAAGKGEEETQC